MGGRLAVGGDTGTILLLVYAAKLLHVDHVEERAQEGEEEVQGRHRLAVCRVESHTSHEGATTGPPVEGTHHYEIIGCCNGPS